MAIETKAFKPPAHKHAHHLHSIPPREKSTRTLILDHFLWIHTSTRFSEARAELGMSVGSTEDDLEAVSFRKSGILSRADFRNTTMDVPLVHTLRAKARGVEKVLGAMLAQPPRVPPPLLPDDDSPRPLHDPHHLPDGVRLRLAIAVVVNQLFTRSPERRSCPSPVQSPSDLSQLLSSLIDSLPLPFPKAIVRHSPSYSSHSCLHLAHRILCHQFLRLRANVHKNSTPTGSFLIDLWFFAPVIFDLLA